MKHLQQGRRESRGDRSGWCVWCMALCTMLPAHAAAQAHVSFNEQTQVFRMDAAGVTYAMGVNESKQLQTLYWGRRLAEGDALQQAHASAGYSAFDLPVNTTATEFAGWGGGLYREPDLKVTFSDGNRDLALVFTGYRISEDRLRISMKDISRAVYVTLEYEMDAQTGIVRRAAEIENRTGSPIEVEQVAAGTFNLPRGEGYRLRYFTGRWAGEYSLRELPIEGGKTLLESRRGSTGAQNNPWFAIARNAHVDEDRGDVWFGALAWSGSWQISVETDALRQVRVTGGPNAFDFGYRLKDGATLRSPDFYGGYAGNGFGEASRLLHRLELDTVLPHAPGSKLRPVLYNSWEAMEFKVDEAGQMALAERAARLGVERFVMDDGWFGQRDSDRRGLGDWSVNPRKFPHGLKPLIDKVHALGMDFGLWVEPEMVNPDSDLYRAHSDWVLNFPGRPRTEGRNQLVLNLARADVRAYVFGVLDKLVSENDIAFLKWDYNRNWSEPGWPGVAPEEQKNVYIDFTRNFYSILEELRRKHPQIEIESCSGGGSRVDLGVLRYADQVWPSDNTDPFDRLTIQNGFSYAYAPGIMVAWVTDSPSWMNRRVTTLQYRFLSAMQGALGVGANLNHWSDEDFAIAQRMVAGYKSIRATVQRGDLYRLISPQQDSQATVNEYVARDGKQTAVFAFLHSSREGYPFPTIQAKGLDPDATYRLTMLEGQAERGTPAHASGAYWMGRGIDLELRGDFQAAAFTLER